MQSLIAKKLWLKPKNQINCNIQSRNVTPVCGPPRFPLSFAQKLIYGTTIIVSMMAIPIWGLLSMPSWAIKHQNLGKAGKD